MIHLADIFTSGRSSAATSRLYSGGVSAIREATLRFSGDDESRLREHAAALRKEARSRTPREDLAVRAIGLITDSIRRTRRMEAYDCQLMAALSLVEGSIAEMATGEGKTLVALMPAFYFALQGRGAHVTTVNPYLASRDCDFARPAFAMLGFAVGLLEERTSKEKKREAYACDVTYGVGTEFGFDYLRDQLAIRAAGGGRPPAFHDPLLGVPAVRSDTVQRELAFAIIDEADSILIDEARSPLIVSLEDRKPCAQPAPYLLAEQITRALRPQRDFARNPATDRLQLTDAGNTRVYEALTNDALAHLRRVWTSYIEQSLQARYRLHQDIHYIVTEGKVVIVDEFTGRPCPDRTWRDGLHQAVEAVAGMPITEENASEAAITRPAYFRLYDRICGMTGTAFEAAAELRESYRLSTRIIPLNKSCRRITLPDRVFVDRRTKLDAVVADIAVRQSKGQPVLIGTRTVANSEELAQVLTASCLAFRLLNARQDAQEADIVARAGEPGTVTVATNMAGRGAHIPLPPESEHAGGLHVIGLERHESARIDRQLVGRAARQGQPGSAQFFLSLEDELLWHRAPAVAAKLARNPASAAGELPRETSVHFLRAQRKVEHADRASRRALAEYDKWLDELKQAL